MINKSPCITLGWYVPTKQGYLGKQRARWVLAVSENYVLYGKGGTLHHECKVSTFRKWIKRVEGQHRSAADGVPRYELELVRQ